MDVSLETLVKINVAVIEMDVSLETLVKINVAVIEIGVSLETLVTNQRCRCRNGRFAPKSCRGCQASGELS